MFKYDGCILLILAELNISHKWPKKGRRKHICTKKEKTEIKDVPLLILRICSHIFPCIMSIFISDN
jgi:hypothetical protein